MAGSSWNCTLVGRSDDPVPYLFVPELLKIKSECDDADFKQ